MLCLTFVAVNAAHAIPLADYHQRVRRSADALDSLRWSADEEASEAARAASETETLRQVRQAIMTVETVEWRNESVRVDNSWLDQSLGDYEKVRASNAAGHEILLRLEERLYALDERLLETLNAQSPGTGQSKDEEKARLAAILRRDEYGKKSKEESAFERLRRRFLKWLDDLMPDSAPVIEPAHGRTVSSITQIIVICVCIAAILFLAWRYGPGLYRRARARRRKKARPRKARVILGERLEADQDATDLLGEAEALARRGELRAAIRKGYIALLCELGDRKVLSLAQSKTNRDYLRAVQGREPLHTEMRRLTNLFENHWYGLAPARPEDWTNFRAGYQKATAGEE